MARFQEVTRWGYLSLEVALGLRGRLGNPHCGSFEKVLESSFLGGYTGAILFGGVMMVDMDMIDVGGRVGALSDGHVMFGAARGRHFPRRNHDDCRGS